MSEVRDVVIIGSGPAGYTAGLYTARAMLNPLMFAGYMSGGQLMLTSDMKISQVILKVLVGQRCNYVNKLKDSV